MVKAFCLVLSRERASHADAISQIEHHDVSGAGFLFLFKRGIRLSAPVLCQRFDELLCGCYER